MFGGVGRRGSDEGRGGPSLGRSEGEMSGLGARRLSLPKEGSAPETCPAVVPCWGAGDRDGLRGPFRASSRETVS